MDCCSAKVLETQFGPARAAAELRSYRTRGPGPTTRLLLAGLRGRYAPASHLLDIGGGIGAIQHELLAAGMARACAVEPAAAFLEANEEEARRRGHADRIEFIHADIRAATVPEADVVTLDRVVCCDPDYAGVLRLALGKARRLFAISYPRDSFVSRALVGAENWLRRLRGTDFRMFVHSPGRMHELILTAGFRPVYRVRTLVWEVAVHERKGGVR